MPTYRGDCLKMGGGGLGQFADLRRGGAWPERCVVFLREVDTPMHTMSL